MANKVKYNISNSHIALLKRGQTDGKITFETPFAVPGTVALTIEPKGERTSFYADGVEYYSASQNDGYEGDLEMAMITDEIREKIFKEVLDSKKVLIEDTNAEEVEFAYGCQIDGNDKSTRIWFYCCKSDRAGLEAKTNEGKKEPQPDKMKLMMSGAKVVDADEKLYVRSKTTDTTDGTTYANWFKAVYIPTFSPEAASHKA